LLHADGSELDINALEHGAHAANRQRFERFTGLSSGELTPDEIDRLRPAVERHTDMLFDRPQFRKIHDSLTGGYEGKAPIAPDAVRGAVYIVRDPRDVAVSMAHHEGVEAGRIVDLLADPNHALAGSTSRLHLQFRQRVGSWSAHVRSWLDHDLFQVLLVRYEDLHDDPGRELERIGRFAGLQPSPAKVAGAVEAAGFERMRAQEAERGFDEGLASNRPFFRRGIRGAWRDELVPELARQVARDHAEVMAHLGYAAERQVPREALGSRDRVAPT
jgi:hypothetical protein